MKKITGYLIYTITALSCFAVVPTFTVDASRPAGKVSPLFFGLMTEEINHSYDGGLYAELIQNRAFLDNATTPIHWSVVNDNGSEATIALDPTNSFNDQLTTSLRLTVTKAAKNQPAGVANSGYWGIPVQPNTTYRATLLARSGTGFSRARSPSPLSATTAGLFMQPENLPDLPRTGKNLNCRSRRAGLIPPPRLILSLRWISREPSGLVWSRFFRRHGTTSRMVFAKT